MLTWTALSPSAVFKSGAFAALLCLTLLPHSSAQAAGGTCVTMFYYRDRSRRAALRLPSERLRPVRRVAIGSLTVCCACRHSACWA